MKIIKMVATTHLLMLSYAYAAPSPKFSEAEQWRKEFRAAMDENTRAINKADMHQLQSKRWAALTKRSEQIFGDALAEPFGVCIKAAQGMESVWGFQLTSLRSPTAINVGAIAPTSFEAGASYWACRTAIDTLESKKL